MWDKADPLVSILEAHLAQRPAMELRDIYKLLYQAVRGPEHLISSPQAFTEQLAEEWVALDPGEDDPLCESIRPGRSLLRLNLRPYKAQGGQLDGLVTACLETARRPWGTQAELQKAWEGFTAACRDHSWPGLALEPVEAFTSWVEDNGYPPVHHSAQYRGLYRPAYRLVAADIHIQDRVGERKR